MEDLLLLHGAIGAKDQLIPLAYELQNDFNVHALNFTGHGGGPIPAKPFSISQFANDVLAYMNGHEIGSAHIFGYSMGGYVGMYLCRHHAKRVKKLVTLATKYEWNAEIAAREMKMLDPVKIEEKIPLFAKQLEERHHPQDWKLLLQKTAELLQGLGEKNVLTNEDYHLVQTPCFILRGEKDKMVSTEETTNTNRELPDSITADLPDTPHPIEQVDAKMVADITRRFYLNMEI